MRIAFSIGSIGGLAIIGACVGLGAYHSASDETIDEIIATVTAARDSIHEFDTKYTLSRIKGGGNSADWETQHFRYLDGMVHLHRSYSFHESDVVYGWDFGYDGEVRWGTRSVNPRMFGIAKSAEAAEHVFLDTEGRGFTDMMLWYPCHEARFGTLHHRDLLSMLTSGHAIVRPEMEWVGDAHCVVVEFGDWYGSDFTIWLDPDRGYLPVLQTLSGVDYELRIDEAAEVVPGVWMPLVGRRLVGAHPDVPELPVAAEHRMEVEFLNVNTGALQHEDFHHTNWVQPGIIINDHDTGELWVVSAQDYSEAADAVLARASLLPMQKRDAGGAALSTAPPWRNTYWLVLIVGCALASGWLFLKLRR